MATQTEHGYLDMTFDHESTRALNPLRVLVIGGAEPSSWVEQINHRDRVAFEYAVVETQQDVDHAVRRGPFDVILVDIATTSLEPEHLGRPQTEAPVVFAMGNSETVEQLLAANSRLSRLEEITRGVMHDVNNILGVVLTRSELASTSKNGKKVERALEAIAASVARASELLDHLARVSSSDRSPSEPLSLEEAIEAAAALLDPLLPGGITLRREIASSLPKVRARATEVQQLLLNLLFNARDAVADGGEIAVRAYAKRGDDTTSVVVEVADDGDGIDSEMLEKIFDPRFTTKADGSGIGLAIVKRIVAEHGATITVESDHGCGACFRIEWHDLVDDAQRPTILLAEDEPEFRESLTEALEEAGYSVCAAADAGSAIELAAAGAQRFDLALLDVVLPDVHGVELAEQLQKGQANLPVVFMSAYPADWLAESGMNPPELLKKPFTHTHLLERLEQKLAVAC